jgi:hypothetical protein
VNTAKKCVRPSPKTVIWLQKITPPRGEAELFGKSAVEGEKNQQSRKRKKTDVNSFESR